jgi:hypothetical protein
MLLVYSVVTLEHLTDGEILGRQRSSRALARL